MGKKVVSAFRESESRERDRQVLIGVLIDPNPDKGP